MRNKQGKMCVREIKEGLPLTVNDEQIYVCLECFVKDVESE